MDVLWAFLLVPIILIGNMILVTLLVGPYRFVEWLVKRRRSERFPMDELSVRRATRTR